MTKLVECPLSFPLFSPSPHPDDPLSPPPSEFFFLLLLFICELDPCGCFSSPFASVSVVLKERRSKDSVTLAWQGPERPNGVIVEYEVIYYEKVKGTHASAHTPSHFQRNTFYNLLHACVGKNGGTSNECCE